MKKSYMNPELSVVRFEDVITASGDAVVATVETDERGIPINPNV